MILQNTADYSKCKNEQEFKMLFLKHIPNKEAFNHFCIETEETVKGFPDVLCIDKVTKQVYFLEFKFTKSGKIKFQPTQPAFYKKYKDLDIMVIAYNAKTDKVHSFMTNELFMKESPYCMNEKAEVDLNIAEVEDESFNS